MRMILATLLLLASGRHAHASALPSAQQSLEWQKIALEERLQEKLVRAIGTSLPEKEFLVVTRVLLKARAKAEAVRRQDAAARAPEELLPLGKLDISAPFVKLTEEKEPELNLFDEIQSVQASIYIDEKVEELKVETIRQIATDIVNALGVQPVQVSVEKKPLAPVPPPQPEEPEWDLKKWALEFRTPLAMLVATIVFCIFLFLMGLLVMTGYSRMEARRIKILEMKEQREQTMLEDQRNEKRILQQQAEDSKAGYGAAITGGGDAAVVEGAQKGLDRIRTMLLDAPEQVASLVSQWLRAPVTGSSEALIALSQVLSTEDLRRIMGTLDKDQKREWRKLLGRSLDERGIRLADAFISAQIVESLLLNQDLLDSESLEILDQIKLTEAVEMAQTDSQLGAILAGLLPPGQVSRLFTLLSADIAAMISQESLRLSEDQIRQGAPRVREALSALRSGRHSVQSPFADRALEVLHEVGPVREAAIFNAIADSGDAAMLEAAAREFFPSELVIRLPGWLLKDAMDRFPIDKRGELVFCGNDDQKAALLAAYGTEGSKLREMLDFEIQEIQNSEARSQRVQRNADKLWRQFAQACRTQIRASEASSEAAETVLLAWLAQKTGQAPGGLRAA